MRPESQHFFTALESGRTYLPELWAHLSSVMTLEPGTQREILRLVLDELRDNLLIEYPKMKHLWDMSATPYLPAWVSKAKPKNKQGQADGIIWSPALSFHADKGVRQESPWLAVDVWLKKTRSEMVSLKPLRERSLDIFGDEKVLDSLITTLPFKNGLITLETLGCYYVPEPIPWVPGPVGSESRYGLCVENSTTYDTLCRFNKEAGLWGFVAYGRGNGFSSMTDGIVQVIKSYGHKRLMYFGDADHEGIEIAARGARRLLDFKISVALDSRLYTILMESGSEAPSKSGGDLSEGATKLVIDAGLDVLIEMFRRHKRIAQEWVGLETLRKTFYQLLSDLPL